MRFPDLRTMRQRPVALPRQQSNYSRENDCAPLEIGQIEAIFRYPVKSMAGESLEVAELGWHGLDGDRRLAFRRTTDRGGSPWLTATRLPQLLLFAPQRGESSAESGIPSHVRTP